MNIVCHSFTVTGMAVPIILTQVWVRCFKASLIRIIIIIASEIRVRGAVSISVAIQQKLAVWPRKGVPTRSSFPRRWWCVQKWKKLSTEWKKRIHSIAFSLGEALLPSSFLLHNYHSGKISRMRQPRLVFALVQFCVVVVKQGELKRYWGPATNHQKIDS